MNSSSESELIDQVAAKITLNIETIVQGNVGLLNGSSGCALFLTLIDIHRTKSPSEKDALEQLIFHIRTKLNQGLRSSTICSGKAGILIAQNYILQFGQTCLWNPGDLNESLRSLRQHTFRFIDQYSLDYLHGLAGILHAVNWCERLSPQEVATVFSEFQARSVKTSIASTWHNQQGYIDIGVAHGVASYISMLHSIHRNEHRDFLYGAIADLHFRFLRNSSDQYIMDVNCPTHRMSWCSSHFGAGCVLHRIYVADGNVEKALEIEKILKVHVDNLLCNLSTFKDTCVCHGGAGIVIALRQIQWIQGDSDIVQTIKLISDNIIKQELNRLINSTDRITDMTILTGLSGVGLLALENIHSIGILPRLLILK
jgi:hypothetical protein